MCLSGLSFLSSFVFCFVSCFVSSFVFWANKVEKANRKPIMSLINLLVGGVVSYSQSSIQIRSIMHIGPSAARKRRCFVTLELPDRYNLVDHFVDRHIREG